jgi:hypothetical protein
VGLGDRDRDVSLVGESWRLRRFFLSPFSQRGLTQGVIDDMKHFRIFVGSVLALGAAPAVWAESAGGIPPRIDSGDTAWVLVSAALVLMMTPALAFFYGGLVRRKNMLSVLMQCFAVMGLITVQWVLVGYSLSFGPTVRGVVGGLQWLGLNGVGLAPNPDYAPTIPHQAFMIYQCMFAIITPGLILGAFAERMKFSAYVLFPSCGARWCMTRWPIGCGAQADS